MKKIIFATVMLLSVNAHAVTISLDGNDYVVTTIDTSFNDNAALLMSQPWWGLGDSGNLAASATVQVLLQLGTPNTSPENGGPLFAWEPSFIGGETLAQEYVPAFNIVQGYSVDNDASFTFAIATLVPLPGALGLFAMSLISVGFARRRQNRAV